MDLDRIPRAIVTVELNKAIPGELLVLGVAQAIRTGYRTLSILVAEQYWRDGLYALVGLASAGAELNFLLAPSAAEEPLFGLDKPYQSFVVLSTATLSRPASDHKIRAVFDATKEFAAAVKASIAHCLDTGFSADGIHWSPRPKCWP